MSSREKTNVVLGVADAVTAADAGAPAIDLPRVCPSPLGFLLTGGIMPVGPWPVVRCAGPVRRSMRNTNLVGIVDASCNPKCLKFKFFGSKLQAKRARVARPQPRIIYCSLSAASLSAS